MRDAENEGLLPASQGLIAARLQSRIYELRGVHVMLDSDLAELYEEETKSLNRAVKRNAERFPSDFMFQLAAEDIANLRCQFGTSSLQAQAGSTDLRSQFATSSAAYGGRRYLPYAFTEQGVAMLSGVLRSERAVQVNIAIMRAFVELRRWARSNEELARKLAGLERKSDEQYKQVMKVIERFIAPPSAPGRRIGFEKPRGRQR